MNVQYLPGTAVFTDLQEGEPVDPEVFKRHDITTVIRHRESRKSTSILSRGITSPHFGYYLNPTNFEYEFRKLHNWTHTTIFNGILRTETMPIPVNDCQYNPNDPDDWE